MRGVIEDTYSIICPTRNEELGTIQQPQLGREAHPGAIYYYLGDAYRVMEIVGNEVRVVRLPDTKKLTKADINTDVPACSATTCRALTRASSTYSFGNLTVDECISSYRTYQRFPRQKLDKEAIPAPISYRFETRGLWIDVDRELREHVYKVVPASAPDADALQMALHGLEHLLIELIPTVALCDRRDLGGHYITLGPSGTVARLYIYDLFPGGIGLAERAFGELPILLERVYDVLRNCPCTSGCPECLDAGWCHIDNNNLDKAATMMLVKGLLDKRAALP